MLARAADRRAKEAEERVKYEKKFDGISILVTLDGDKCSFAPGEEVKGVVTLECKE